MRIALVGFGNVGRAFATLLSSKAERLSAEDLVFPVTSIVTAHHGWWTDPKGIDLSEALRAEHLPERGPVPAISDLPADVLVELTTLEPRSGQPALDHIRQAMRAGMHVVTANKGPIAHGYEELRALARDVGRVLRFEATVADCLPAFDLRRAALPLAEIRRVRGIVSSTTNHILSAAARGIPLADSLAEAQRLGIAEADPRNDLEGWDAAAKATILANALMGARIGIDDVSRETIDDATARDALHIASEGARLRPLIHVAQHEGQVVASFGPRRLEPSDPLYAVDGLSMALELETDLAGTVVVQLREPHVEQVAYAVLTDLLEIAGWREPV